MALVARRRLLHEQAHNPRPGTELLIQPSVSEALDALSSSVAAISSGARSQHWIAPRAQKGAGNGRALRRRSTVAFATVSMAMPLLASDAQRAPP